ncbi:MAG: tRNA 2-thiouridine(34) synthase MnmA [Clostridia bacterium]|nr:tRNA 2-thiouridine(34) synthase MnmA [Clostridia bacterium]
MKTVAVGMSGGVDSSVAAYLLKKQGYNVIGIFMHNWQESLNGFCSAEEDYEDVKRVCAKIDIPYYTVNFSKEYYDRVFKTFLSEYSKGRTPNPDVLCNREIKFGPFLNYAQKIGADYIATGHYAKTDNKGGLIYLLKALDKNKDQSYFLNQLSQDQLKNTIFPLADITKPKVREIALKLNLAVAQKKDSTGICFIGERRFREFLSQYIPAKKGDIIDIKSGKKIGEHMGVMYYTIGQRKGLGIGGVNKEQTGRWFVIEKDVKANILYVQQGDESMLYSRGLTMNEVNWIPKPPQANQFYCSAKFRYRQSDQCVSVNIAKEKITVEFEKAQRAVTCGQYAVFYDGEYCLGGGIIEQVII